jgi:hypothetical protein
VQAGSYPCFTKAIRTSRRNNHHLHEYSSNNTAFEPSRVQLPVMESSSGKLVDLTLISKHYPVANYSYPHKASASNHCYSNSGCSSNSSHRGRESLGSEGSAPGLIEDRTDSEASLDDDYQYHAHTTELWDSFWPHRSSPMAKNKAILSPNKQYPALILSPHRKRRSSTSHGDAQSPIHSDSNLSSPASKTETQTRTRQTAATYSAFPKITSPPPTRKAPPIPAHRETRVQQRPLTSCGSSNKPQRPPRPLQTSLTPLLRDPASVPVGFGMADFVVQKDQYLSPVSPPVRRRPTKSCSQRPSKSLDEGSSSRRSRCTIYSVISHSATHLPVPEIRPSPTRTPRHFKSLAALNTDVRADQEPHSVFEDDSDSEETDHGRKFFTFHKRSDSDQKRRRNRSNTTPQRSISQESYYSPSKDEMCAAPAQHKRHGHDVLGRLLGRRSR